MFGELSGSYDQLSKDQRTVLAKLLSDRNDYNARLIQLNELRIKVLTNPTPAGEAELSEFSSVMVAPLRQSVSRQMTKLVEQAVDIDKMQGLLPLILMGLTQAINVPLLMTVVGAEPDMIDEIIKLATRYFNSAK